MSSDLHPSLTAPERNPDMCHGRINWHYAGESFGGSRTVDSILVDLPEEGERRYVPRVVFERTPYGPVVRDVTCPTAWHRIEGDLWIEFTPNCDRDERVLGLILKRRWAWLIQRAVEEAA